MFQRLTIERARLGGYFVTEDSDGEVIYAGDEASVADFFRDHLAEIADHSPAPTIDEDVPVEKPANDHRPPFFSHLYEYRRPRKGLTGYVTVHRECCYLSPKDEEFDHAKWHAHESLNDAEQFAIGLKDHGLRYCGVCNPIDAVEKAAS